MDIRNWNEIIGKNGIRIEIDFFSEWKLHSFKGDNPQLGYLLRECFFAAVSNQ